MTNATVTVGKTAVNKVFSVYFIQCMFIFASTFTKLHYVVGSSVCVGAKGTGGVKA